MEHYPQFKPIDVSSTFFNARLVAGKQNIVADCLIMFLMLSCLILITTCLCCFIYSVMSLLRIMVGLSARLECVY